MQYRSLQITDDGGPLDLAWVEWGEPEAGQVIVCVHGLTRNARDFDALARALAESGARVLCVDVAGRGKSGWLEDPMRYTVPVYARQLTTWLDALGLESVDWVGTSMGGLIALEMARSRPQRFRRLVLNDIGPFIAKEALAPIKAYLGLDLSFPDLAQLEAHLRAIHAGFGQLPDEVWRHLAMHSARREGDRLRLHYDPRIREPFLRAAAEDIVMWDAWQALTCPVLVLRGADSAILARDTAERMTTTGPRAKVVVFAGVGHAPALFDPAQIATVADFLAPPADLGGRSTAT